MTPAFPEIGPSESVQAQSVLDRLAVVRAALGLKPVTSGAGTGMAGLLEAVCETDALMDGTRLEAPARAQLLLLCLWGRYPNRDERDEFLVAILGSGIESAVGVIVSADAFRRQLSSDAVIQLVDPGRQVLVVDVSHTVDYPYNSGIQRVVRKLAKELQAQQDRVIFIRTDGTGGQPRQLGAEELERLVAFNEARSGERRQDRLAWVAQDLMIRFPKRVLRYWGEDSKHLTLSYYHRLRDDFLGPWSVRFKPAKELFNWVDREKMQLKAKVTAVKRRMLERQRLKGEAQRVLLLLDANILVPELVIENERLEFYLGLKSSGVPNVLSLIFYDLIPVFAPEHCVVADHFLSYLRLLRVADRVSCISKSVMKDVENFAKIIPREVTGPMEVASLYLGGDFQQVQGESKNRHALAVACPRILCVGTFEPRKNQVSILRAAYLLRSKGLAFELAFVGNPGWRNAEFELERQKLDPGGSWIKVFTSAPDKLLDELYRDASFTVFCSLAEGFGLPILESVQRGKPVVTSDRGSMRELGDHVGGCIYVDPTKVLEIANAMERFLTDREFYQSKVGEIRSLHTLTWREYALRIRRFVMDRD